MNTKQKWFDLPKQTGEAIDKVAIAWDVFIERFSQGTFDFFMNKYFGSDENSSSSSSSSSSQSEGGNDKEEIIVATENVLVSDLEKLTIAHVPDDWEDLVSDEE
jgi:hypothetical protein